MSNEEQIEAKARMLKSALGTCDHLISWANTQQALLACVKRQLTALSKPTPAEPQPEQPEAAKSAEPGEKVVHYFCQAGRAGKAYNQIRELITAQTDKIIIVEIDKSKEARIEELEGLLESCGIAAEPQPEQPDADTALHDLFLHPSDFYKVVAAIESARRKNGNMEVEVYLMKAFQIIEKHGKQAEQPVPDLQYRPDCQPKHLCPKCKRQAYCELPRPPRVYKCSDFESQPKPTEPGEFSYKGIGHLNTGGGLMACDLCGLIVSELPPQHPYRGYCPQARIEQLGAENAELNTWQGYEKWKTTEAENEALQARIEQLGAELAEALK